ncbi:MAG: dmsA [Bacillota bacterium]|nr:dmsA [Bacillota bacterium]
MKIETLPAEAQEERIIRSSGALNCGGRCVLKLHVKGNTIVRISTEDDIPDGEKTLQLRGCLRCRSYRSHMYHPDRIQYPLKRIGKRGEGKFQRITWEEALDTIAENLIAVRDEFGPDGIYLPYATGNPGLTSERVWMRRLLGLFGGYLSYYGSYSSACTQAATPYTYGTTATGNSREDILNSKLMILVGWNPAEMISGTNTSYYLRKLRESGTKIICIDPMYSATAATLADQWIPIRPTTDNALFDAMAHVMVSENLHDQAFLDRYCLGFDEEHMPEGIPYGNSYKSYVLGLGPDGIPKTPAWAQAITGIPAETITALAREYATVKPGALIQGLGPQRHAYGEQIVRGGTVLAAITGNVGISGGWASGSGYAARDHFVASIPAVNPNPAQISMFCWPDAILRGKEMGPQDSLRGADGLKSNIKLMLNLGGNCLINQHSDINRTKKILEDEELVRFIAASDHFVTPSTRFADILLPSDSMYERDDIIKPWDPDDFVLFMNQAVKPQGECRNGYDWISDLAGKLGLLEPFTEGRTLPDWHRYLVDKTAEKNPGFPDYETFKQLGIYRWEHEKPCIAFEEQILDPENNPFPTPSGKIEIFSKTLWEKQQKDIPAVPQYLSAWEGPEDELTAAYPLQCIGHHTKRRVHSTFDNSELMEEVEPHAVWINTQDAEVRTIRSGDRVKVYNARGMVILPAKVTVRVMPGVVSIPQGAWWTPDENGTDTRGCVNTLTKYQPTPLAFGNPSHTCLVQITMEEKDEHTIEL